MVIALESYVFAVADVSGESNEHDYLTVQAATLEEAQEKAEQMAKEEYPQWGKLSIECLESESFSADFRHHDLPEYEDEDEDGNPVVRKIKRQHSGVGFKNLKRENPEIHRLKIGGWTSNKYVKVKETHDPMLVCLKCGEMKEANYPWGCFDKHGKNGFAHYGFGRIKGFTEDGHIVWKGGCGYGGINADTRSQSDIAWFKDLHECKEAESKPPDTDYKCDKCKEWMNSDFVRVCSKCSIWVCDTCSSGGGPDKDFTCGEGEGEDVDTCSDCRPPIMSHKDYMEKMGKRGLGAESFAAEGGCVHHNYPMAGTPDLSFDNDGSVWYEIVCGNCGATAEGAFYPEEWGEEMYAWNDAESFSASSGKRMYCPNCEKNRTWMRGFREYDPQTQNPYDFAYYTCKSCQYVKGAESFSADGYKGISAPKIEILEWYVKKGGKAGDFHDLPTDVQIRLQAGNVHELLYQDVNRWLQDNGYNPHMETPDWLSAESDELEERCKTCEEMMVDCDCWNPTTAEQGSQIVGFCENKEGFCFTNERTYVCDKCNHCYVGCEDRDGNIPDAGCKCLYTFGRLIASAESFAAVPSGGTGSPGQMCEVCNESDDLPYDSDHFKECRRCGKSVCHECWDTDIESDEHYYEICGECWIVLDNVARYDAESFSADEKREKYLEQGYVSVHGSGDYRFNVLGTYEGKALHQYRFETLDKMEISCLNGHRTILERVLPHQDQWDFPSSDCTFCEAAATHIVRGIHPRCDFHYQQQFGKNAESFSAEKGTRKCYGCGVFIPQGDMAGMIKNQRGNKKWICRPCRGKTITRPYLYGSIGLQRRQSKHPENVFDKMPDLPQRTVGMIPCIVCKDDEFEDKLNKAGVCQNCLRRATNKFVPFIPKEMGAESFSADEEETFRHKQQIIAKMMRDAPACESCGNLKTYTPTEYNKYTCWSCKDDPSWGAESYSTKSGRIEDAESFNAEVFEGTIECSYCKKDISEYALTEGMWLNCHNCRGKLHFECGTDLCDCHDAIYCYDCDEKIHPRPSWGAESFSAETIKPMTIGLGLGIVALFLWGRNR